MAKFYVLYPDNYEPFWFEYDGEEEARKKWEKARSDPAYRDVILVKHIAPEDDQ